VAEVDIVSPGSGEDPGLMSPTFDDELRVVPDIVRAIVATMPFGIVFELMPQVRHVTLPTIELQDIDLPALVAALPAEVTMAEKSEIE
jgi:hypothetical protein